MAMSKGSSTLLKIVLALTVVAGLAVVALAAGGYFLYQRAARAARSAGLVPPVGAAHGPVHKAHATTDLCRLLPKDEAAQLIGEPVDHTQSLPGECRYYGPAGLSTRLAQDGMGSVFARAQAGGSGPPAADVATGVVQALNAAAANSSGTDAPLLIVIFASDGGQAQMTALAGTRSFVSAFGPATAGATQDIPGLGDRATRLPMLGLNVLQGDAILRVLPGAMPGADAKGVAVARALLPRLAQ